jgi:cysteine desulfurase
MSQGAYLDHNATTPPDPRVVAAMARWTGERFGNPSSSHAWGRRARGAVEEARERVAQLLGADTPDVVFTASGSEANNAAIFAVCGPGTPPGEILISAFEHPSVTKAAYRCERWGMRVREVPPRSDGVVPADDLRDALSERTRLVCLMLASNVVGTVQPVTEVAAAARERGVPSLCDAVQAVGKIPVRVAELGCDFVTLGGHKLHGPLGAAALWIRPGVPFAGWLVGGEQEGGRRAGTVDVPAVVGLGEATRWAAAELEQRGAALAALRDSLEAGLDRLPGVTIHARQSPRLPHTTCAAFAGVSGPELGHRLDARGFAVSTGPACGAGAPRPAAALLAMGVSPEVALSSLRISFGMTNTRQEVTRFLGVLAEEIASLRGAGATPAGTLPGR